MKKIFNFSVKTLLVLCVIFVAGCGGNDPDSPSKKNNLVGTFWYDETSLNSDGGYSDAFYFENETKIQCGWLLKSNGFCGIRYAYISYEINGNKITFIIDSDKFSGTIQNNIIVFDDGSALKKSADAYYAAEIFF
ncbi:MAG: hypothetical protein LBN95_05425 [Prevotellaceae bacterium]|jgi:hypothetical protein|nr:hypothetical protein [Prevotellaceae bacterium]